MKKRKKVKSFTLWTYEGWHVRPKLTAEMRLPLFKTANGVIEAGFWGNPCKVTITGEV